MQMLYPDYKRMAPPILCELSGGLQMHKDLAREILRDESKKKIVVFPEGMFFGHQRALQWDLCTSASSSQNMLASVQGCSLQISIAVYTDVLDI